MKCSILILLFGIILCSLGLVGGIFYTDISNAIRISSVFSGASVIWGKSSLDETSTDSNLIIYVYPAITDNKVLPTTAIPKEYISNKIQIDGSPSEYRPASFIVYSPDNISSLIPIISDLTGEKGTISKNSIDIKVVKVWYQAGLEIGDVSHKTLTPELLIKDDSLIKLENRENYVKLTDGKYKWISDPTISLKRMAPVPIADMPIKDSSDLQPVDILAGTNKQFWITLHIPQNTSAGKYTGQITLRTSSGTVGKIFLELTVLPINLSEPYLTYSIYYTGALDSAWPQGSISHGYKSEQQIAAELKDLYEHGAANPTCYQYGLEELNKYLAIRSKIIPSAGKPLYDSGLYPWGYQNTTDVQEMISIATNYGYTDIFFYGVDEGSPQQLLDQRPYWQAIKNAGGKIFVASYTPGKDTPYLIDIIDQINYGDVPNTAAAAQWHSAGHLIFSYNQPQSGEELPGTYRRNYGLRLWQQDFDGAMDFAYQAGFGNIWNDFDDATFRDHNMTYPTMDGVVDTIEWEGFREGINDVRYLTTLLDTIKKAKATGKNTSDIDTWLVKLKSSSLTSLNLDSVRGQIINYILYLKANQNQSPGIASADNKTESLGGVPKSDTTKTDLNHKTVPTSDSGLLPESISVASKEQSLNQSVSRADKVSSSRLTLLIEIIVAVLVSSIIIGTIIFWRQRRF